MGFGQPAIPQQSSTQISPAQQNYQNTSANFLANQVGNLGPAYPGALGPAPLSQQQATSIGQIGAVGQQQGAGAQAQGLNTLGNYSSGAYLFDPFTAGLMKSTADYANQQFNQAIPAMESQFIASGQTGPSSPMAQYLTSQRGTFDLGLQNQLSQQALGSYNTQQQNQLQAANQAATQGGMAQNAGLSALSVPQGLQSQALQNAYADWLRIQNNPWQAATSIPNLTGMPQGSSGPPLYGPSPFQQLTSGISAIAPLFSLFM